MSPLKVSALLVPQHAFWWLSLLAFSLSAWTVNVVTCFSQAYLSRYCKIIVCGFFLSRIELSKSEQLCILSRQPWLVSWVESVSESFEQIEFCGVNAEDSFRMTLVVQRECILCTGLGSLRTCFVYCCLLCFLCTVPQ